MIIPKHVGFIMDGNRRWARKRGLPTSAGHKHGFEHIPDVLEICHDFGIQTISIYCWSTENWARPKDEVEYIISSLETHLPEFIDKLHEKGIRFFHSGRREELSPGTLKIIDDGITLTQNNGPETLNFLFNYGGRAELVEAVKNLIKKETDLDSLTEASIERNLWTAGLPDVELVIRSGGDSRLSNFMLWQIAYASIFISDKFWPEINGEDILAGIKHYNKSSN